MKARVEGAPEGVAISVILAAKPKTADEFEAIIDAAGGPENFRAGYEQRYIVADLDGAHLHIDPPPNTDTSRPVGHPFIAKFLSERVAS